VGGGDVIFGVSVIPYGTQTSVKCLPPLPWERNFMFSAVFVLEDSKTPG